MDFGLTETQELVRKSAREFLAERVTPSFVREAAASEGGYPKQFWREVAELGWTGLLVPSEYGGAGMSFAEMAVLLEEWGAHLAPGPMTESSVAGVWALANFGSEAQKRECLPRVVDGSLTVSTALVGPSGYWQSPSEGLLATPLGAGWRISGKRGFVLYAGTSGLVLAVAETPGGPGLFLLPAEGASFTRLKSASGAPLSNVGFDGLAVASDAKLERPEGRDSVIDEVIRTGAVARSLQMAGAARAVLEMTVAYVSDRKQFGRPVGSFQALQHRLAELATEVRGARHLAYRAAWLMAQGRPSRRESALAKMTLSDLLPRVCAAAHQLHGAIGFTMEHNLHLYTRRAIAWRPDFGDAAFHREEVAASMRL